MWYILAAIAIAAGLCLWRRSKVLKWNLLNKQGFVIESSRWFGGPKALKIGDAVYLHAMEVGKEGESPPAGNVWLRFTVTGFYDADHAIIGIPEKCVWAGESDQPAFDVERMQPVHHRRLTHDAPAYADIRVLH